MAPNASPCRPGQAAPCIPEGAAGPAGPAGSRQVSTTPRWTGSGLWAVGTQWSIAGWLPGPHRTMQWSAPDLSQGSSPPTRAAFHPKGLQPCQVCKPVSTAFPSQPASGLVPSAAEHWTPASLATQRSQALGDRNCSAGRFPALSRAGGCGRPDNQDAQGKERSLTSLGTRRSFDRGAAYGSKEDDEGVSKPATRQ